VAAVPSKSEVLFACSGTNNNVVVLNTSTGEMTASIPVGVGPSGIFYDSTNNHAYVTNSGTDNVSVIDLANNNVVASINVNLTPDAVTYDSLNGDIYVANCFSNNVTVINAASNLVIKTVPAGAYPKALTFDSGNGYIYAADYWPVGSATVTVINGASNSVVATIPVGALPKGIAYDWGNGEVYVADSGSNNVTVISAASDVVVGSIPVGLAPVAVAYDSAHSLVLVTNSGSNNVTEITDSSNALFATVAVGPSPQGLGYDGALGYTYVSDSKWDKTSVVDDSTGTVVATFTLDLLVQSVVYDPGNGDVYVADNAANTVKVISGATNTISTTVAVGAAPDGLAYDSGNGEIYVANSASDSVTVITDSTNTVATTVGVGTYPMGVAYDPVNGEVYVVNGYSNNVTVINGTTHSVAAWIQVGPAPQDAVYANGYVYVTYTDSVCVISAATNAVIGSIEVGTGAAGLAYDSGQGTVYVANSGSSNMSVIFSVNNSVMASLPGGYSPNGVGYDGTNGNVFVTETSNGTLDVISGESSLGALAVGPGPVQVTYDTGNGFAYVVDSGDSALSIIAPSPVIPMLSSVNVYTSATGVPIWGHAALAAMPSCTNGGCPSGEIYNWTINNTLALLGASTGLSIPLNAGGVPGNVSVRVNATLHGIEFNSSAEIRIDPLLTAVVVTPSSMTLPTSGSEFFNESATCHPAGCPPSGIVFTWSLNNTLGTLLNLTGPTTILLIGFNTGSITLKLNATLDGMRVNSSANITIMPGLAFDSVSPVSAKVPVGGTQVLTAASSCIGGPCPAGVTYIWSLNNTLGSLNSTSGPSVRFTAGSFTGPVVVAVNASVDGLYAVAVSALNLVPSLSSTTVSPASSLLAPSGSQTFSASTLCTGGPCPSGTAFVWSLSSTTLGSLNSTEGQTVTFTASSVDGQGTVTAIAALDGQYAFGTAGFKVSSSLPVLAGLTVSPSQASVMVGDSMPVNATATCLPAPCPTSGIGYAWTLNMPLGVVSPLTSPSTIFTAGYTIGAARLTVTGSLYGISASATTVITISASPVPHLVSVTIIAGQVAGRAQALTASVSCSPGTCPGYVTYLWKANNSLGNLSSSSGQNTTFIEGNAAGLVTVTVTAFLDARSVSNITDMVILPSQTTVAKVSVTPTTATVDAGGSITFRATAVCFPDPTCPTSITLAWSTSNGLGKVVPAAGYSTVFTAGQKGGILTITVTATLGSGQASASASVTVNPPSSGPTFLGLPAVEGYLLLVVVIVAVVVAVAISLGRRKRGEKPAPTANPSPAPVAAAVPTPPPQSDDGRPPLPREPLPKEAITTDAPTPAAPEAKS
jgi:YVTN family beta-propeller protein